MMFAQTLRSQLAEVYRMVWITAYRDGLAIFGADQHSTPNRTVTAGRLHPRIRYPRRGDMTKARIFLVGILSTPDVDTQRAADLGTSTVEGVHRRPQRANVRAMLSGTTETKNR